MKFILLTDIPLYDVAEVFMEVSQNPKQFLIWFIDPFDQLAHLCFFEIFAESFETVFHELAYLNWVMIFMVPINGQASRANQTFIFTVSINTNKSRIFLMSMTIVGFDELIKAVKKVFHFVLGIHEYIFISQNTTAGIIM